MLVADDGPWQMELDTAAPVPIRMGILFPVTFSVNRTLSIPQASVFDIRSGFSVAPGVVYLKGRRSGNMEESSSMVLDMWMMLYRLLLAWLTCCFFVCTGPAVMSDCLQINRQLPVGGVWI